MTRHGEIAYQVLRYRVEYDDGTFGKDFRQRQPSGNDWVNNLTGVERVLYRLPDVLRSKGTIFLPEGEKDAERLASFGLTATTLAQGAQAKLTPSMIADLAGRDIVILADHDEPGRDAAETRAAALHGIAHSVKVLLLSGLSEHGDVSDWLDAGRTVDDLAALVDGAPEWQPRTQGVDEPDALPMLMIRSAADIVARLVDWLWRGWLPIGMLTLFAGYGGGGKSTTALYIAAAVSTGGKLPDGQRADIGNVLYLAGEDTAEYTLVPRLKAMGADLGRISIVDGVRQPGDDPGWVNLREHIRHIEATIRRDNISLLVIDPVSSFIGDANSDRESDVRSALAPLGKMAERTGCAVLMIRHLSKGGGDGHRAASRILGSTAWHDLPRVAWMLGDAPDDHQPDPHDDGTRDVRRVLGVVKSNIAAKPAAQWFEQPTLGPLFWLPGPSPVGIDACFAPQDTQSSRETAVDKAAEWLRQQLAGGSKAATQVYEDGERAEFSEATIRRAKKAVRADSYKVQGDGRWYWRLPHSDQHAQGAQDAQGERAQNREHLGEQVAIDDVRTPNRTGEPANVTDIRERQREPLPPTGTDGEEWSVEL